MLIELRIRNFAIIEALSLPLAPGFNVLSGETGAGKSIVVGALGLLLGERASTDLVRTGTDRAVVEGVFDVGREHLLMDVLDARGVEVDDGLLVLKREVAATGRARAWINGTTVTAGMLAEVGRQLVNLHGQHEAQSLVDAESQRRILDAFAGAAEDAAAVRAAFHRLASIRTEFAELERRRADAERRADYLRHVAREIEAANLEAGEESRLEEEARRLEHAEELRLLVLGALQLLEQDDDAVLTRLGTLQRTITSLERIDPSLSPLHELYDAAFYAMEELVRRLADYGDQIDLDPTRLAAVQQRRELLHALTRKYGSTLGEVLETAAGARAELDLIDSAAFDLRELERREQAAAAALGERAEALSGRRHDAARRLGTAVDELLPALGMPDGRLSVTLTPCATIAENGAEDVEFRVALNLGHDARPLGRVASGGELSRVMLAIKSILARLDGVPTLVFDEVDAGIGGRVALDVGEIMRRLAEHHQVFAITHLPQLAARAHHHILVAKGARGGVTTADITVLADDERVHEVARMLGGDPESAVSRAHARELLVTGAPVDPGALPPTRNPSAAAEAPGAGPSARPAAPTPKRRTPRTA